MYISVKDLLVFIGGFILVGLISTVCVYLIIVLNRLMKLVQRANTILDENRENIGKTFSTLPQAINNVNELSVSIRGKVDSAGNAIGTLEGAFSEAAAAMGEGAENFLFILNLAGNLVKTIVRMFHKERTE